jgi:hypothetical protein
MGGSSEGMGESGSDDLPSIVNYVVLGKGLDVVKKDSSKEMIISSRDAETGRAMWWGWETEV